MLWITNKTSVEEVLRNVGHVFWKLVPGLLRCGNAVDGSHTLEVMPWRITGQHLHNGATETPEHRTNISSGSTTTFHIFGGTRIDTFAILYLYFIFQL